MTERSKTDHLLNFIEGRISSDVLLRLVPTADLKWLAVPKNQKLVKKLWKNYKKKDKKQSDDLYNYTINELL